MKVAALIIALSTCGGCGGDAAADSPYRNTNPEGFRVECFGEPLHRVMGAAQEPRLIEKQEPRYSPAAQESKISGIAIVALAIRSTGEVCDAKIVRGLDPAVDGSILEAVLGWHFMPAILNGEPIAVVYHMSIPVDFRSADAAAPNPSLQRTAALRASAAELMIR